MTVDDFRRIALSLEGAEESSHAGSPDFRVGGRIFATLASARQGYGNLMLTPKQQSAFVNELPEIFLPIKGGWGRMGMTHIKLAIATEDILAGAVRAAWKVRVEKNSNSGKKNRATIAQGGVRGALRPSASAIRSRKPKRPRKKPRAEKLR